MWMVLSRWLWWFVKNIAPLGTVVCACCLSTVRLKQEDCYEFQDSMGYRVKPCASPQAPKRKTRSSSTVQKFSERHHRQFPSLAG